MTNESEITWQMLSPLFQAHPWHGVPIGHSQPEIVTVYIEIVPSDTIKFELDKYSGLLRADRPQAYSNICPTMYGFVPQTICREQVAAFCCERTGRANIVGDDDPVDICVLSEKEVPRGNLLLEAIPIGGLRMIDGGEADDKIVAVLKGDAVFSGWQDISDCPKSVVDRLRHYFLTYKNAPDGGESTCEITHVYGRSEAHEVIRRAHADYLAHFGAVAALLAEVRRD
jgi:inorganic pyrophosphatase